MYYRIKIKPFKSRVSTVKFALDDFYDNFIINDENETVYLFLETNGEAGIKSVTRYSIPLAIIESMEIIPIYEDNRETISSC